MTERRRLRKWLEVSFRVYQHLSVVLGGVAMAAAVSHFVDIDWRGFLSEIIGYWDEIARPLVSWVINAIVVVPMDWLFNWHINVLPAVKDYVAIGVILSASLGRSFYRDDFGDGDDDRWDLKTWVLVQGTMIIAWPCIFFMAFIAWFVNPIEKTPENLPKIWKGRVAMLIVLSPLFYLGLLVAANYLVL